MILTALLLHFYRTHRYLHLAYVIVVIRILTIRLLTRYHQAYIAQP